MKKLITPAVLVLCHLLALSGFATDKITPMASDGGVSAKEPSISHRAAVINRLEQVGYSKEEATARVGQMTNDEIAYFAQHPESIKRSGFILIASSIGSSIYSSVQSGNKKREAYVSHLMDKIADCRSQIALADNKRMNQRTLATVEQDPAKKAEFEAEYKRLGDEIDAKQDQIKSLEREVKQINSKKKKVPNQKDW